MGPVFVVERRRSRRTAAPGNGGPRPVAGVGAGGPVPGREPGDAGKGLVGRSVAADEENGRPGRSRLSGSSPPPRCALSLVRGVADVTLGWRSVRGGRTAPSAGPGTEEGARRDLGRKAAGPLGCGGGGAAAPRDHAGARSSGADPARLGAPAISVRDDRGPVVPVSLRLARVLSAKRGAIISVQGRVCESLFGGSGHFVAPLARRATRRRTAVPRGGDHRNALACGAC
jgi:hypothetical protein